MYPIEKGKIEFITSGEQCGVRMSGCPGFNHLPLHWGSTVRNERQYYKYFNCNLGFVVLPSCSEQFINLTDSVYITF